MRATDVAFTVVATLGYTWQQALGAVFISGVIFLILTVTGIRSWLIRGIPKSLQSAIAAGIGMFLGLIALMNSGIVVAHPATKIGLGDLTQPAALYAILGFFIIAALDALNIAAISVPAITMLTIILAAIPSFIGAVLVFSLGARSLPRAG